MARIREVLETGPKVVEHEGPLVPVGGGVPGGPAVELPVPGAGFNGSLSDIGEGALSPGSVNSAGSLLDVIGGHNPHAGGYPPAGNPFHVGSVDTLGDQAAEDAINHSG